jgi:hypothetical protein
MTVPTTCPVCKKKLRIPDHLAGRRVTCPRCGEAVRAPERVESHAPEAPAEVETPLPLSSRLGIASLLLGMISVLLACLPFVGSVSPLLSGLGLLLGLGGLVRSLKEGGARAVPLFAGGSQASSGFGARARDYPLAGTVACLLALILVLLPWLRHWPPH